MVRGKISVLSILFLICWQILLAQSQIRIYETIRNQPLASALDHLSRTYNIIFAYNPDILEGKTISVQLKGVNLDGALERMLRNTDIEYVKIKENQIVLRKKALSRPTQNTRTLASSRWILYGVILDEKASSPLPYASIYLAKTRAGTYADSVGKFRLVISSPDDSLIIKSFGYEERRLCLSNLTSFDNIEIRLKQETHQLEEVMITEGSEQTLVIADGASEISLNPQRIQTISGLGEPDIFRSLQLLPGISASQESSSGLNIRGGTADQNLILFDGITIYQPGHFFGSFSAFNTQATKDVEVYRGGFSAKYGGRASSVLNITGKPGNPEKLSYGGGINMMNANAYLETPLFHRKAALLIAGRRSFSDIVQSSFYHQLFDNIFQQGAIYDERILQEQGDMMLNLKPAFHFDDLNVKLTYRPGVRDLFSVSFYQGGDLLTYVKDDPETNVSTTDTLLLKNTGLSLNWARQWTPKFYSKTTLARSRFDQRHIYKLEISDSQFTSENLFPKENQLTDYSFRLDNEWKINARNQFVFGGEASHQSVLYRLRWFEGNELKLDDLNETEALTTAGYAEYTLKPFRNLSLTGGMRSTWYSLTDKLYLEPRTSVALTLSEKLSFKGSWSLHNQFMTHFLEFNGLSVGEEFWVLANGKDIPVVSSEHLILGGAYRKNNFLMDIELYQKRSEGLVAYSYLVRDNRPEILQVHLVSNGISLARGVDILLQNTWGNYSGWVSYSLARVINQFPDIEGGNPFPGIS